jgi:putative DNA primase/helicase
LFASWSAYAKAAGDLPGTRKSFARLLERHRFTPCRIGTEQARGWRGIRLKPTATSSRYGDD